MNRASYKLTAKRQLTGKWVELIVMCFLYGIFFGCTNAINLKFGAGFDIPIFILSGITSRELLSVIFGGIVFSFVFMIALYPLLHGALTVGQSRYFVDFVESGKTDLNTLFGGFKNYKTNYLLSFSYNLYLMLWSIIPIMGIIKMYSYSLTFYIKAVHPEYSAKECITKSRQYMNGYKWDLFVLDLSFFGWVVLCVLTLGIGYLWFMPYVGVTEANIYHDMLVANGEIPTAEKVNDDVINDGLEGIH